MTYFWLKVLHIAGMAAWFTGLFLLPRLFIAGGDPPWRQHEKHDDAPDEDLMSRRLRSETAIGNGLYFRVMTPAALLTVGAGLALMTYGFAGAWLPAKLGLVAAAVLLHLYLGNLLPDLAAGRSRHAAAVYRAFSWAPVLLLLGIAALAAVKPAAVPPLGGL